MKTKTLLLRRTLFLCAFLLGFFRESLGQPQDVFSRSEVNTGSWSDNAYPWYYSTWGNQVRPDVNNIRNYVKIGHNNNLSMTTNDAFFALASLDFQSAASSPRTIAAGGPNTGLSFTIGIYNASTANHNFSTNIGVDASTVNFQNNNSGGMVFSGNIYLNSNIAQFGGSGNGNFDVSGVLSGTGGVVKNGTNSLVLTGANTYTGSTTINAGTLQLNKTGGNTLPNTNSITVSNGGTLRISTNQTLANLTINSGGTVLVDANVQLTINGTLTNNGTMTIESGATLVQTTNSSTVTGSGTYQVKQTLSASGRHWYLGVPLGTGSYTEQNFLDLLSAGDVLRKRTESSSTWDIISGTGNNTAISAGKGFNLYINNTTPTLTFQGTGSSYAFNNGSIIVPLTSSGSSYTGYNLVCNPYPSYVDWSLVSNTGLVDQTIWYRIYAGGAMTFGTINAGGISTTVGGVVVTKYLPPMQAFWVKAASGGGSLTFDNEDRTHFVSTNSSVAGLKNTGSNNVFIRMNIFQGEKTDQLIVYTDPQASPELDAYDSDKMMQLTLPQIYTKVGNQKTVINALHPSKKRQSIPVITELPSTGIHHFEFEELEIGNGIIWLEDKQEEIMQALVPGTVYEFYANSGINSERFVLHFQLIDDAVPINVYNEVNSSANFSRKGASVYAESAGVVVIKLPASSEGVTDIQIRDAAGKLVYAGSMNNLETSVELSQANGIYYVTLSSNTGVEVRKVFIQQ